MACKQRLIEFFAAHHVPYAFHALRGRQAGSATIRDNEQRWHRVAQVAVAVRNDRPVMLVVGPDRDVDLRLMWLVLGREHIRFAGESEIQELFPDCEPGAMPALGNLYGLPVYLDAELATDPEITFLTGSHRESVTIPMSTFEWLTWPTHASLAAKVA